jgi:hypothetical protein
MWVEMMVEMMAEMMAEMLVEKWTPGRHYPGLSVVLDH